MKEYFIVFRALLKEERIKIALIGRCQLRELFRARSLGIVSLCFQSSARVHVGVYDVLG